MHIMHTTDLPAHDNGEGSSNTLDGAHVFTAVDDESDADDPLTTHVQDQELLEDDFLRDDAQAQ